MSYTLDPMTVHVAGKLPTLPLQTQDYNHSRVCVGLDFLFKLDTRSQRPVVAQLFADLSSASDTFEMWTTDAV